jgi:hypothetical protein
MHTVRQTLRRLAAILFAASLPFFGACVGWLLATTLISVPEGEHCGLAVLPSLFVGAVVATATFVALGTISAHWLMYRVEEWMWGSSPG